MFAASKDLPIIVLWANIVVKGLIIFNFAWMLGKRVQRAEEKLSAGFIAALAILLAVVIALFFSALSHDIVFCLVSKNSKARPIIFETCQHVGTLVAMLVLLSLAFELVIELGNITQVMDYPY